MSASVLREAAALMRERAEAAIPGPWVVGDTSAIAGVLNLKADTCAYCRHDSNPEWVGQRNINGKRMRAHVHRRSEAWDGEVYARRDDGDVRVTTGTDEYGYIEPADAEHIASWHPAVALAVADWLEAKAEQDDKGTCDDPRGCCNLCEHDYGNVAAIDVARAYLGRAS